MQQTNIKNKTPGVYVGGSLTQQTNIKTKPPGFMVEGVWRNKQIKPRPTGFKLVFSLPLIKTPGVWRKKHN